jgi:hypothetical protein
MPVAVKGFAGEDSVMVKRTLILAFLAMIAGVGCNAGTSNNQVRQPAALNKESLSKTRIIAQINKNAEAVRSLQADSTIEASDEHETHNLKGKLRLEREKDFRLVLNPPMSSRPVADIGSNDKGFWFWVYPQNRKDNNIYVCDYDHVSSSRLSVTMQPDWIMEAMGLRQITPREAATIDARPGETKGQLLLTQLRKEPNGVTYTKETLVNELTGEIIEHRLYAGAKKELLARATIKSYKNKILTSTSGDREEIKVSIPDRFTLDWVAEKFKLEITMPDPVVNPQFPKEMVTSLFSEPTIAGAMRIDLAAVAPGPANASSFIHETMPRSGIRLGQPQAVPSDENRTSKSSRSPASSNLDGLPELPAETSVIGPLIPQGSATDPAAVQASTRGAWRPVYEN